LVSFKVSSQQHPCLHFFGYPATQKELKLTVVELGPCNVTANLTSQLNPYSWSEISNLLFLSQPIGVGFSYGSQEPGTLNNLTGDFQNASIAGVDGRKCI
jgi:hypothetical protein